MFLEKCGRFFFFKMRPAFFFALMLAPLVLGTLFIFSSSQKLDELEGRFMKSQRKEKLARDRQTRKEKFITRYSNVDPFYLDKRIESFSFLEKEKKRLLALQEHPAYPKSPLIEERLAYLFDNQLAFVEDKIVNTSIFKETEERGRSFVQMDEKDLHELLILIEDSSGIKEEGRPQLLIKDFKLRKIQTPLQTEVFEVKMDLIKREFIR